MSSACTQRLPASACAKRPSTISTALCSLRIALPVRGQRLRGRTGAGACRPLAPASPHKVAVRVQAFSLAKSLGLSGGGGARSWLPRLPDLGLPKRQAVLDAFFCISDGGPALDRQLYEALLAPDFRWTESVKEGEPHSRSYFKADFIELMCACVAPAIPDFTWSAATDGVVDADGFAVVEVKVSGHHTGAALALPGLPPLQPSGRRLALETEYLKVKVEGERIKKVVALPSACGAGPLALYRALGGQAA